MPTRSSPSTTVSSSSRATCWSPAGTRSRGAVVDIDAATRSRLRRTVLLVAGLNLSYFGVEVVVALAIGSVALLADSVDFLEDTAVNLLIALALGWSLRARARTGKMMACLLYTSDAADDLLCVDLGGRR